MIVQSIISLVVMGIAWGVDVHFVKPDYMAALITSMISIDRLFDHISNLIENIIDDGKDDTVNCGELASQIFKVFHNFGLVLLALFLSNYSQELYFFIENEEITKLEELTDSKNWFFNQTVIGDYYTGRCID